MLTINYSAKPMSTVRPLSTECYADDHAMGVMTTVETSRIYDTMASARRAA